MRTVVITLIQYTHKHNGQTVGQPQSGRYRWDINNSNVKQNQNIIRAQ